MDGTIQVAEVRAGRGARWLTEAFDLFRRKPVAWIGLCSGWLVITLGLLLVPFIGGVVANFLQPVFFASFAIAAFRQGAGEPILMGDLFSGFRRNIRALINLGAILLMAQIAIFMLMWAVGLPMGPSGDEPFTMAEYLELLKGKEWILVTGFVLTAAVKGALWFAPPLIAFHDMAMAQAIRWSVYAAIANLGAMIVYGLVLGVGVLLGIATWGLGLFIVIPVMAISTFVGYREVFEADRRPLSTGTAD
jgi:hypothetical protein